MKWLRPSGNEIETNDSEATIEYCESIGWKRLEQKKRGPKPKVKNDEHRNQDSPERA